MASTNRQSQGGKVKQYIINILTGLVVSYIQSRIPHLQKKIEKLQTKLDKLVNEKIEQYNVK